MSDELVRWRTVIKRQWEILSTDLCSDELTSSLLYLPGPLCSILQDHNEYSAKTRVDNAELLLKHLLQWEDERWPQDFLEGLRTTHQAPLANYLAQGYQQVIQEESVRKDRFKQRKLRHLPFTKHKHKKVCFMTCCAQHTSN